MEFLGLVSFIRCSVLSSLWLRWRWSGNQWVTRFFLSLCKSELFSSQSCRFRQRILANLDPSRGLLIGSRELLWKLCSIEMRLLPWWYHLLFSSYKLFIGDFFFLFRSSWLHRRQRLKTLDDRITIFTQRLLFIRCQHHRLWGVSVSDLSIAKTFRLLRSSNRKPWRKRAFS